MDSTTIPTSPQEIYAQAGWFGLVAFAVMVGVRAYRLQQVQDLLPDAMQWDKLGDKARKLIVFAASMAGSALVPLLGGADWQTAAWMAFAAWIGAAGLHEGTKKAGAVLQDRAEKKNPEYAPSKARRAASIIVPIPQDNSQKSEPQA